MILKLKPEIKAKWLKVLRSNQYKQINGRLREVHDGQTGFCCLGVLCNLHAEAHPEFAAKQKSREHYDGETHVPPRCVLKWAFEGDVSNIDTEVAFCDFTSKIYHDHNQEYTLAGLNDSGEYSFKKIAKVIEKYL